MSSGCQQVPPSKTVTYRDGEIDQGEVTKRGLSLGGLLTEGTGTTVMRRMSQCQTDGSGVTQGGTAQGCPVYVHSLGQVSLGVPFVLSLVVVTISLSNLVERM